MKKSDLVSAISEKTDLTIEEAGLVLHSILRGITGAVSREAVTLVGFGTFGLRRRGALPGKDPQTGDKVVIAASNTVVFKPGKNLKDRVNSATHAERSS